MIKKPSPNMPSVQRHFQDLNALLIRTVRGLSGMGSPTISTVIQDITRVARSLLELDQEVGNLLTVRQSQLEALMSVGQAINSSLSRTQVLEEVMDAVIKLMRAERGFLMMLDKPDGNLQFEVARGIANVNLGADEFKLSMTIARRVVETGEVIITTNAQEDPRFENQLSVAAYKLRSILCVPLKIKNKLIGVIYVDNKVHTGMFGEGDRELISAFADQAAVAIDNARLFEELKATNFDLEVAKLELEVAYEATLKGWVDALDLRDKETNGHTQRVTTLTERLARAIGVQEEELVHIRHGALLHDIGKMAIPDEILLKKDKLTDEERACMQEHPSRAYKMLYPIEFLRSAIVIPHCHHEKWDGTGYPLGLKGEEIPFYARIFAVIDVWDALTNDRPYHKALPYDKVREIIRADSGKHFDPRVVEAFLRLEDLSL
ncbi:MAG TPA: HD domain-containing phosphohydrolase [Anaerolineales bacterium]|nr:HD domain-containing phosphohydrolase [Anaerolineales bacterium]